jgi:serine/threonine protein kinase
MKCLETVVPFRKLGAGAHADVWAAFYGEHVVALKIFSSVERFVGERDVLRKFKGLRYLPQLIDDGFVDCRVRGWGIVMPLLCANTARVFRTGRHVLAASRQLREALASLKNLDIAHNDIKPDNILYDCDNACIVLNDYSSACRLGKPVTFAEHRFVQPHRRSKQSVGSHGADVYSAAKVIQYWAQGVSGPLYIPIGTEDLQQWLGPDAREKKQPSE